MNYLSNKNGFLGIDNKFNFKEKVVIVPFGLEKTVSYGGGTKNGPKEIIKASHQVELYDEELNCEPYKEICDRAGMCIACYDGYIHPMDWRADYNLNFYSPFRDLTWHEKEYLKCAWNKEVHTCTEGCSKFICFKYTGETCAVEQCFNLFVKTRKNMNITKMRVQTTFITMR